MPYKLTVVRKSDGSYLTSNYTKSPGETHNTFEAAMDHIARVYTKHPDAKKIFEPKPCLVDLLHFQEAAIQIMRKMALELLV